MTADTVQARYEQLDQVAARFARASSANVELQRSITRCVEALERGGWQGRGADAFFAEMHGTLYPAMQRLVHAMEQGRTTTLQVKELLRAAEEEAAQPFRQGSEAQIALSANADQSNGSGVLGFVGDLFGGAGAELGDMVHGVVNLAVHPIETVKGIWYGVNHPSALWEAFKQPYVEDWENGHPGRSIGRGILFAGSLLLGTKGADKALKAVGIGAKGAETAEVVGKLVNTTGRVLSVSEESLARLLVGEGKVVEVVAESTVQGVRTADFAVNGLKTELKTISNVTSNDVSGAVSRRALDGAGQAPHIILDARNQANLTQELAERAARRAYGADKAQRIQEIRIIGESFDITVPRIP